MAITLDEVKRRYRQEIGPGGVQLTPTMTDAELDELAEAFKLDPDAHKETLNYASQLSGLTQPQRFKIRRLLEREVEYQNQKAELERAAESDDEDREGRAEIALEILEENRTDDSYSTLNEIVADEFSETDPSNADPEKIRLAQQAVLLSIMEELALKNKPLGYDPKMILVDGDPDFLVNNLAKKPGEKAFTNICPEQLSELTPYVRIYKVIGTERYEEKHVEYSFDQGITASEVDALGAMSYGRGRGGGLKSIDWAYDGSDPFTASRSIQVNMNFFFQSLDELLRERIDATTGETYKYVDLILQSPGCRQDRKEDEEAAPDEQPKTAYSEYIEEFNPECFEIKLDLGWSDPGPNSYNKLGDIPENRRLTTEAIEAQRTSLFLTFKDHELNIQQDGTVTLQANYQGRIAGLTSDPRANVFLDPKSDSLMSNIKKKEDKIKALKKQATAEKVTDIEKKALDKAEDKLNEELRLIMLNQRQSLVASIVRELYDNNYLATIEVGSASYRSYINSIESGALIDKGLVDTLDYKVFKLFGRDIEKTEDLITELEDPFASFTTEELKEGNFLFRFLHGNKSRAELLKYFREKGMVPGEALTDYIDSETKENYYAEHVEFNYFYLGDLVDIITKRVLDPMVWADSGIKGWRGSEYDNAVEKIRIILGTVDLKFAGKDDFTTVNLADIPISLALFLDWMKDNVIDSDRKEYPFIRFIQDIMKSLVSAALGSTVFENSLAQKVTVQKTFFSSAANNGIEPFTANGGVVVSNSPQEQQQRIQDQEDEEIQFYGAEAIEQQLYNEGLQRDGFEGYEQDLFIYGKDGELRSPRTIYPITPNIQYLTLGNKKDTGHYHYIMFFMDNKITRSKLKGNEVEDEINGLYHYRLGEKCGLLKEAKFKKTNVQFFREARLTQIGSGNPLAQLSNVYDLDLTMVGNNIYIPGRRIYFDPRSISSLIGAPYEPGSPANLLGIGGYHIVTDVKSFIQDGKFHTEISTTFETGGGDTANIRDSDDEIGGDSSAGEEEAPPVETPPAPSGVSTLGSIATPTFEA
jgi:hypothetical protein